MRNGKLVDGDDPPEQPADQDGEIPCEELHDDCGNHKESITKRITLNRYGLFDLLIYGPI